MTAVVSLTVTMAQYQLNHPDDLIACPYNASHLVKARRFPYHLIKCRKNNPDMDYAVCPFNARHEMPYAELRYHIARCIDRTVLEQDIAHAHASRDGGKTKGNTRVPAYDDDSYDGAQTEDWDCEPAPYSNSIFEDSTANAVPTLSVTERKVNTRKDAIGIGELGYKEGNRDEESDKVKWPSQIGANDIHNDMPTTRPPRGLPAVLQMAQQLRLSDVEKRDDKVDPSLEKNKCATPVTMDTRACDNQSRKIHEQSLQTFARGRGLGRGTAVPPVGCAIQKPTSALCKGQGVVMSVGRGVMCISQFSEIPVVNRGRSSSLLALEAT